MRIEQIHLAHLSVNCECPKDTTGAGAQRYLSDTAASMNSGLRAGTEVHAERTAGRRFDSHWVWPGNVMAVAESGDKCEKMALAHDKNHGLWG